MARSFFLPGQRHDLLLREGSKPKAETHPNGSVYESLHGERRRALSSVRRTQAPHCCTVDDARSGPLTRMSGFTGRCNPAVADRAQSKTSVIGASFGSVRYRGKVEDRTGSSIERAPIRQ